MVFEAFQMFMKQCFGIVSDEEVIQWFEKHIRGLSYQLTEQGNQVTLIAEIREFRRITLQRERVKHDPLYDEDAKYHFDGNLSAASDHLIGLFLSQGVIERIDDVDHNNQTEDTTIINPFDDVDHNNQTYAGIDDGDFWYLEVAPAAVAAA